MRRTGRQVPVFRERLAEGGRPAWAGSLAGRDKGMVKKPPQPLICSCLFPWQPVPAHQDRQGGDTSHAICCPLPSLLFHRGTGTHTHRDSQRCPEMYRGVEQCCPAIQLGWVAQGVGGITGGDAQGSGSSRGSVQGVDTELRQPL